MKRVGVIGTGNMGGALLESAATLGRERGWSFMAYDVDSQRLDDICSRCGAEAAGSNHELVSSCDTLILAVKPQHYRGVLEEVATLLEGKRIISVMAGVTLKALNQACPRPNCWARVMPNLPALIGKGALACTWEPCWEDEEKEEVLAMLGAMGMVVEVPETLMDAVTGLSGSGPAYLFLLVEALSDAGVRAGLPRDTAYKLSLQTVLGSAEFLKEKNAHPVLAKEMVTSPGGTTIAALNVLENRGFKGMVMDAVMAATERSKELGG